MGCWESFKKIKKMTGEAGNGQRSRGGKRRWEEGDRRTELESGWDLLSAHKWPCCVLNRVCEARFGNYSKEHKIFQ